MPKKSLRPDSNQIAALIVAKAAGISVPERLKKYAHLVKKTTSRKAPKKRTK